MTRRHTIAGRVVAGLAMILMLAAVVTIVIDSRDAPGPTTIEPDQVPFALLRDPEPVAPTTTTGTTEPSFTLFLVTKDSLVAVQRVRTNPPSPHEVLEALIAGPTKAERDRGLTSLVPADASLRRVSIDGYRAVIDLAAPLEDTARPTSRVLPVAQFVYTATALPGVTEVRFLLNGKATEVPTGNSTLTRRPVTRDDYPVPVA